MIEHNLYFEEVYFCMFVVFFLPMFASFIIYLMHWMSWRNKANRDRLPLSLLIATISSFLIWFWILVYIFGVY